MNRPAYVEVWRLNQPTPVRKSDDEIANEVIANRWGTNPDRANRLRAAGYNPDVIQNLVNQKLSNSNNNRKPVEEIAREVLAGKWGNGADRSNRLRAAGYNPDEVQRVVNNLMNQPRYYTVQAGDTLSGIGQKLGIRWETLASNNNLNAPYTIHRGQQLRY